MHGWLAGGCMPGGGCIHGWGLHAGGSEPVPAGCRTRKTANKACSLDCVSGQSSFVRCGETMKQTGDGGQRTNETNVFVWVTASCCDDRERLIGLSNLLQQLAVYSIPLHWFISRTFHPKNISSEEYFIRRIFHQKNISSEEYFIQRIFRLPK